MPFEWEISKSNMQFQYHVFWLAAGCIMSTVRAEAAKAAKACTQKSSGAMWSMSCITSLETHRKDQKAVAFGWKRLWLLWTKWSLWKGESIGIFHDRAASSFSLLPYGQQTAKSRGSGTQNCVQNVQTIQILQGSPMTLTCSAAQCILSLRIHDHESFVSSPRDLRLGRFVTHLGQETTMQSEKNNMKKWSCSCPPSDCGFYWLGVYGVMVFGV